MAVVVFALEKNRQSTRTLSWSAEKGAVNGHLRVVGGQAARSRGVKGHFTACGAADSGAVGAYDPHRTSR